MDVKEFANRLSVLRKEKGLSVYDMSLKMGKVRTYIGRVEKGEILPTMEIFFSMCDILGITPREFFDF